MDDLLTQLSLLPEYWGAHVVMTGCALTTGVLLSLPLGVLAARSARWGTLVVSIAAVVQTIPGLALLALMVPLLGAFGFWPALSALILYSMLPVLRNTVTGLRGVEPAVLEAAQGVGMTPWQSLFRVELPLALPVIVAGVRTAAVWVVGVATLSTPVGQASLGNFIFAGLQTRNWVAVVVGCVAAAVLALALDGLLAWLSHALRRRHRSRVWAAAAALVAVLGLGALAPFSGLGTGAARTGAGESDASRYAPDDTGAISESGAVSELGRRYRIGSKTFTEQYILAHLIERRLREAGLDAQRVESLGSSVAFDALRTEQIDVYVDYTGTLYANAMKRTGAEQDWKVLAATAHWLATEHGVRQLGALGFENAYALAVTREMAQKLSRPTIDALVGHAPALRLGSDYEFFQRPEWTKLRDTYGLSFAELVSFDSSFMYAALDQNEVQVITAFSSDGRIRADELVVLEDTRQAFPPYDAVLLLSPRATDSAALVGALLPLIGAISVDSMRAANWMVDRETDKRSVAEAAAWLDHQVEAR